jgi:hypothetical protein
LPLAQSHAGSTAVLVDEFDAGQLEGSSHNIQGRATRLTSVLFELVDSHDADTRAISQILLAVGCMVACRDWARRKRTETRSSMACLRGARSNSGNKFRR